MSLTITETVRLRLKSGIAGTFTEGYTVTGVLTIQELLNFGVDVYNSIYAQYGFTSDDYDVLPRNDVIYSLVTDDSIKYNIPKSVVETVTEDPVVPYRSMVLAISLGEHPEYKEFTLLRDYLQNAVIEYIGVTPSISILNTSDPILVPEDRHVYLEALRDNISATIKNSSRRLVQREQEMELMRQEIIGLRKFINEYLETCAVDCTGDDGDVDAQPTNNTRMDKEPFEFNQTVEGNLYLPCNFRYP